MSCNDDFSAEVIGDIVLVTELEKRPSSGHTRLGLERARFVINSRVDDTAVVPRLVLGKLGLLLQEKNP